MNLPLRIPVLLKNSKLIEAHGHMKLIHARDQRWDVVNHLIEKLEKIVFQKIKEEHGPHVVCSDAYTLTTYEDDLHLHITLSLEVGTLEI